MSYPKSSRQKSQAELDDNNHDKEKVKDTKSPFIYVPISNSNNESNNQPNQLNLSYHILHSKQATTPVHKLHPTVYQADRNRRLLDLDEDKSPDNCKLLSHALPQKLQNDFPGLSSEPALLQRKLRAFYEERIKSKARMSPAASVALNSSLSLSQTSSTALTEIPAVCNKPENEASSKNHQQQHPLSSSRGVGGGGGRVQQIKSQAASTKEEKLATLEKKLKEINSKLIEKELSTFRVELSKQTKAIQQIANDSTSMKTLYSNLRFNMINLQAKFDELNDKIKKQELLQQQQQLEQSQGQKVNNYYTSASRIPRFPVVSSESASGSLIPPYLSLSSSSSEETMNLDIKQPSIDFDQLIDNLKELNNLINNGTKSLELCFNTNGATFKSQIPKSITITFYKNGYRLNDKDFYSFICQEAISFISDIYDGYLPTILQSKYPNGVIFHVQDKRTLTFSPNGSNHVFVGVGYKLMAETTELEGQPSKLCPSTSALNQDLPRIFPGMRINKQWNANSTGSAGASARSLNTKTGLCLSEIKRQSKFEEAQCSSIITDKKSFNLLNSTCSSSKTSLSSSPSSQAITQYLPDLIIQEDNNRSSSSSPKLPCSSPFLRLTSKLTTCKRITLKLKDLQNPNGIQYKLIVSRNITIDQICQHLNTYLKDSTSTSEDIDNEQLEWEEDEQNQDSIKGCAVDYELINSVPFGIFAQPSSTLKEYGIVNNCRLYYRKK